MMSVEDMKSQTEFLTLTAIEQAPSVTTSDNTGRFGLKTAVVVCTHNRPAVLERCLQRLCQINDPSFSIVVVDSAPKSYEAKSVTSRYGAQYKISAVKGLSRARNVGTEGIDADIIAYLDDDMVPHDRWLESLTAEFADQNVIVATGPVLGLGLKNGSDVDLQLAVGLAPLGPHRFQVDQSSRQWFERANFGGVGDGNFAIRRAAFDKIRGFDERLGRGASIDSSEEHYAFFRLVEAGFKVAYAPGAIVFHPNVPPRPDVVRKRIADAVAFAAFLAWNHPAKSLRIAKFFIGGAFNSRRWWGLSSNNEMISISARERFVSGLNGLYIFLRSIRESTKVLHCDKPNTRQ
jgi:cellulose synthase/poly-beta-1,6-N-acetylglucosamine synthase-like glycosyltransferase